MHWYSIAIIVVGSLLNGVIVQTENKDLAVCLQSLFNIATLFLIVKFLKNIL